MLAAAFLKAAPARLPISRAKRGPLAARGEMGARVIGGTTIQFSLAPHTMAAKERIAVGAVKRVLELFKLSKGGC